jgi:N-acyl-D-aspartate/D-glutamate deacylase
MLDLKITGARLIDGTGAEARTADVGVKDGRIIEVGRVAAAASRTIKADGLLLAPGWVDIHTHYDGQVCWDRELAPSSWQGVTTVVMGNCGVGFAPVRRGSEALLINIMEGVEDIPGTALHEGVSFDWESFPQYLNAIDREYAVDVGAQAAHGAFRTYVMGERAQTLEAATEEEARAQGTLAEAAIRAGALGFTTSRTMLHRAKSGDHIPSYHANQMELTEIARGMARAGAGVFEWISDFADLDEEFGLIETVARVSGRPLTFSLMQADQKPQMWREMLSRIDGAQAAGLNVRAQVAGRPVGILLGLEGSIHPFVAHPSYQAIAHLPLPERVARLKEPAFRAALLTEQPGARNDLARFIFSAFHKMFPLGNPPVYEPLAESSIAAHAARSRREPAAVALDFMLADEGRAFLYFPLFNYTEGDLDNARTMITHPHTVFGLGDGGAHVGTICDGSFPTFMASWWGRDRPHGRLPLEWLVMKQSRDTARAVGLYDRGVIAPGYRADLNLIDFGNLGARAPQIAYDLPAGGKRLLQRADGYVVTVCAGAVTFENGVSTGALPGRLVRGAQMLN